MTQNRRTGRQGEALARRYLEERGYRILATNWHCAQGELDIVARLADTLVFVEVRTRRRRHTAEAFASITARKRERLLAAVQAWLAANRMEDAGWRLDVVAVALGSGTQIDHVEDALDW